MSVLSCQRHWCDNIMCDRYSHEHGYICNECFEELTLNQTNIHRFMRSEKPIGQHSHEHQAWLATCEETFPI